MSYQLEREMQRRVTQYHNEAATQRALPRSDIRQRVARSLRSIADRIEARSNGNDFVGDRPVVLQGRNQ